MKDVLIIAGENSGEKYGAAFIRESKALLPGVRFFGIGGKEMAAEGADLLFPLQDLAVVGLFEVISHIPKIQRILKAMVREAQKRSPAAAVLIDSPDFNLRLARRLKKLGIPVLYYVSPTVWAWRRGRLRTIRKNVRKMLLIFPFEQPLYEARGIPHAYVGHPLLARVKPSLGREAFFEKYGFASGTPLVALLPGSRKAEIAFHMPVLMKAACRIKDELGCQLALIKAESLAEDVLIPHIPPGLLGLKIVAEDGYDAMAAAGLVIAACGTANLETAFLGTPLIAFYRLSPLTYGLGRPFVKISTYSIVNILAGRRIVPELIQSDFTAENIFGEAKRILESVQIQAEVREEFRRIRESMAMDNPSARAARELAALIEQDEGR